MAIKFVNYVLNHVKRGETSRVYDLLGIDCAVTFYPFWCRVTAVAPRRKQGDFGTGKSYRLVGYSSKHKGGYELWNEETERSVGRDDVHHLRFFPHDLNPQPTTHDQPQTDSDNTTVIIDDDDNDFIYQPKRDKFKHRATPTQSLSLSRISHLDDSDSDSRILSSDVSLGSDGASAEQVSSHTPSGMREGDADDTMSDPAIRGRPARSVRGGEQWFTTSQLGSPPFSSPASAT